MRRYALALVLSACSTAPKTSSSNAATTPAASSVTADHLTKDVSIIVEPSDQAAALVAAINAATISVHVTMYLMTDYGVEDAIVAKAAAGLDVKVVLDGSEQDGETTPENQSAYNWFTTHGVTNTVWSSTAFTYTHEKCIIIDGVTAWIMTMNTAHTSPLDNREYLGIDTDAGDVAEAEQIFEADYAQTPITPHGSLVVSPVNSDDKITEFIYSAEKSVDLEVEELSDDDIVQALCINAEVGIPTRALIAAATGLSNAQQHAVLDLENCGVTLNYLLTPYIHAKAIVVDGKRAFVGSENFTEVSLEQNRELGFITANAAAVQIVATQVAADITAGKPVPPPPSCNVPNDCASLYADDACDEGMCQEYCYGDECQTGYVCKTNPGYTSGLCVLQTTVPCTTTADCVGGLVCGDNALCGYCQHSHDCPNDEWCLSDGLCDTSNQSGGSSGGSSSSSSTGAN